jgi:hypothetical protein
MTVHHAEAELLDDRVILILLGLLLLLAPGLPFFGILLEMNVNFRKVTLAKVSDDILNGKVVRYR